MSKLSKPFSFTYLHKQKVVRDLKIVEDVTPLTISGIAYCNTNSNRLDIEERYDFDLESIDGMSPLEILQHEVSLDDINEAAFQHVGKLFDVRDEKPNDLFKSMCRIAYSGYVSKADLDKVLGA